MTESYTKELSSCKIESAQNINNFIGLKLVNYSFQKGSGKFVSGDGNKENDNDGDYRSLLETNVTIISNEECQSTLQYNMTTSPQTNKTVSGGLPYGITYGFVCAKGCRMYLLASSLIRF